MPGATAYTDVMVCNQALGLVGQRQTITALINPTAEARVCSTYYATTRDWLLERYDWSFCTAWVTLTESAEERDGWTYTYTEPASCLRIRYLWTGDRPPVAPEVDAPWERMLNNAANGFLIATDLEDAKAVYHRQVTSELLWTPAFVNAFIWALAVRLAAALPVKPQVALAMAQGADRALREAAALDFNVGKRDAEPEGGSVRAR